MPRSAGCGIDQISQCTGHQLDIIAEHDLEHCAVSRHVSYLQDMLAVHIATVGARGLQGTSDVERADAPTELLHRSRHPDACVNSLELRSIAVSHRLL